MVPSQSFFSFVNQNGYYVYFFYDKSLILTSISINLLSAICIPEYYSLKMYYFPQKEEFIFSCLTKDGGIQIHILDKDFEEASKPLVNLHILEACEIYGYSILYSYSKNDYFILSDAKCDNNDYSFININNIMNKKKKKKKKKK